MKLWDRIKVFFGLAEKPRPTFDMTGLSDSSIRMPKRERKPRKTPKRKK